MSSESQAKRFFVFIVCALTCCQLYADSEYYPFNAVWNRSLPLEIEALADRRADLNSRQNIRVEKGYLVDDSGKRAKFWGAAIRLTNKLLFSPAEDKKQLVVTMKNLGFNEIRFNGLDFNDPGIYAEWQRTGKFNKKKMGGLCELIEYARDTGISYTLSVNHITSKFSSSKSLSLNRHGNKNKRLKQVQFYDDAIIDQTKKWFSALLSEKHNGCRFAFSEDPNLYYLNIVNEDSIFQGYAENFRHLTEKNIKALEHRFYDYVISTFGSLDVAFSKWTTEKTHDLRSNISADNKRLQLCYKKSNWPAGWCNATVKFLISLERRYFTSIKQEIKNTGYEGVITTTNNWYGYFNLISNNAIGDAINTHIYFDQIVRKKVMGKRYEAVTNYSFINDPFAYNSFSRNHVFRLFASSTIGKPLIISEWNHLMWSDYAYEGAVLLTAVALLQDVQSMSLHTFVSKNHYKNKISKSGLSVLGNPVQYALLPSLSCAFLDTPITDSQVVFEFDEDTSVRNWEALFNNGMAPANINESIPIQQGFKNKIRKTIGNQTKNRFKKIATIKIGERKIQSVPDIINWDRTESGNEHLVVKTESFRALVGMSSKDVDLGGGIKINPADDGAITLCALDGNALGESKKILITSVSKSKNTGQNFIDVGLGKKNVKIIMNKGKAPQYLKKNIFDLVVSNSLKGRASVRPLLKDSNATLIAPSVVEAGGVRFNLGEHDTPWYVLEYAGY